MKTIYVFLGILLTTSIFAQQRVDYRQPLDYTETGEVILREVLHYPGKSKTELAELAEEWFARKFDGELIQFGLSTEERNKLVGRGFFSYPLTVIFDETFGEVSYVLIIALKPEKIKVEMEEILIVGQTSVINVEDTYLRPKPAHEVISDEALYKRNGKARNIKRKHKEKILEYWYNTLSDVDAFIGNEKASEEDW